MVSKCLVLSVMALVTLAIPGWAQPAPELPWECKIRDPSLTESACIDRLKPDAAKLPQCVYATGNEGYRLCVVKLPSDDVLAERKREAEQTPAEAEAARKKAREAEARAREAEAEAVHKRLSEKLKAAGIVLPAGMSRLPTPNEAERKVIWDPLGQVRDYTSDDLRKASGDAEEAERRAINAGLGEIVFPEEERRIESIQDAAERAERYAEQHPTLTLAECRIHLRLGMSSDQVIDNCGNPLQHFYRPQGGDVLVYPGGAVLIVPPVGLSEVIEDDSLRQLK
jgi:hypothetical protein